MVPNNLWKKGMEGVIRIFVGNFCLTVSKKFVGEIFSVSLSSGIKCSHA